MSHSTRDRSARSSGPDLDQVARQTSHRPWPPPARPWLIAQTWRDLLFAHWPVAPTLLRPLISAPLQLETYLGDAWLGVVPFHLSRLAPHGAPERLGLGFPELNVRTYVTHQDKPGVWFFSLDAARLIAVIGARVGFHLPYYWASMRIESAGWVEFTSRRRFAPDGAAEFAARYWPSGAAYACEPGSLEDWLTARFCLYAADRSGRLFRAEINHDPWALQPAQWDVTVNTMAPANGIELSAPPLLHFARRLDMVTWGPERLS